ncbi:hypothetical protein ACQP06_28060 [Nocardia sp. CA-136227]|uniref:hypothetical protein n=1 Tax=Nocardia sp. CA-136227 TaxID=3239979 RepID=UPI003D989DB6
MNLRVAVLVGTVFVAAAAIIGCSHHSSDSAPACGPGTPIFACPGVPVFTPSASPTSAIPANGLVAARHKGCDFGQQLLHYLATGDNSGDPWYDQNFADAVGVTPPQARAIADAAIQKCDNAVDSDVSASAAATSAAISSAAAATSKAQADKLFEQHRLAACTAIGGRYDTQWGWCASTVPGNPSGKAGANCEYSSVKFDGDHITPGAIKHEQEWYPGCFPNA